MSKFFACALVLGSVAAAGIVMSAGCASSAADKTGDNTAFASGDGGDASTGPAHGNVVISQLYGGGGRTNATFNHDFVELFNRTAKAITLDGMSLQLSDTATTNFTTVIPLTGSLPSGGYFLVQLGSENDAIGADLPTPIDATSDTQIGSQKDGKVAIAFTSSPLNCGGTGDLCAATKLMDLVGFGQASQIEGLISAPALDETHAALRGTSGCSDVDDNSKDFTSVTPPAPRSSGTTAAPCPVPVKDGGSGSSSGEAGSVPPVKDPPLGPESPFDGGVHPEAGPSPQSGGADGDCAVGTVGAGGASGDLFAAFAGLGLAAAVLIRTRRRLR